jgi:hypothetical protein
VHGPHAIFGETRVFLACEIFNWTCQVSSPASVSSLQRLCARANCVSLWEVTKAVSLSNLTKQACQLYALM